MADGRARSGVRRQRGFSRAGWALALAACGSTASAPAELHAAARADSPGNAAVPLEAAAPRAQDGAEAPAPADAGLAPAFDFAAEIVADDPLAAGELVLGELLLEDGAPAAVELTPDQLQIAFRIGTDLAAAGHLERAAELQLALHASARAEWSAINATLSLVQLGRQPEARALLQDLLSENSGLPGVWSHLGLLDWSAGDLPAARLAFGHAVRLGSRDAAVNLGRIELRAGRPERARAWFRSGLDDPEARAWALRGWGLSLLPADR